MGMVQTARNQVEQEKEVAKEIKRRADQYPFRIEAETKQAEQKVIDRAVGEAASIKMTAREEFRRKKQAVGSDIDQVAKVLANAKALQRKAEEVEHEAEE